MAHVGSTPQASGARLIMKWSGLHSTDGAHDGEEHAVEPRGGAERTDYARHVLVSLTRSHHCTAYRIPVETQVCKCLLGQDRSGTQPRILVDRFPPFADVVLFGNRPIAAARTRKRHIFLKSESAMVQLRSMPTSHKSSPLTYGSSVPLPRPVSTSWSANSTCAAASSTRRACSDH